MLANQITLNDGTDNHVYDLVSRSGMTSVRRETGVSSTLGSVFEIKNDIDLAAPTKHNRHLVRLAYNDVDAVTGEVYPVSVHLVVSRHKKADDAKILKTVTCLGDFLAPTTDMTNVLIGGN